MNALLYVARVVPIFGLAANRLRFPKLRTGLRVEIAGRGQLTHGAGVALGEGTRIDVFATGVLSIADDVQVGRNAYFWVDPDARLCIGAGTRVQDSCRFYGNVAIGRACVFAPNVFIASGAHAFDAVPYRTILDQDRIAPMPDRPVRVFDDCWFGINTVVTPGVTVARGCVIGANAVVTHDLPPYSVAGGNPARVLRQRMAFVPKPRIEAANDEDLPYFYDGFDGASASTSGAHVAEGQFVLALDRPGARAVRLCLSGEAGTIIFKDRVEELPRNPAVVEFRLDATTALPFLTFHTSRPSRLQWAELI